MTATNRILLLIAILALPQMNIFAQSGNKLAQNWFTVGLQEKTTTDKIYAFSKAIEIDSFFVEALFNLGQIYFEQENYHKAQYFLQHAVDVEGKKVKSKFRAKILVNLVEVYKKIGDSGRLEKVYLQLIAVEKDKKMRSQYCRRLAGLLRRQGRYDDALTQLKIGKKLVRGGKDFDKLISLYQTEQKLQPVYKDVETMKTNENFDGAKLILLGILSKYPDLDEIKGKIAEIDSLVTIKVRREVERNMLETHYASLYDRARMYEVNGNVELAILTYENLVQQAGGYKDASRRLYQMHDYRKESELNRRAEEVFAEGLVALNTQNWTRAVVLFEKSLALNDTLRNARLNLKRAKSMLQHESIAAKLNLYYTEGVAAMDREDYSGALISFNKVRSMRPGYRDITGLIETVEKAQSEKTANRDLSANLDSLYAAADSARFKNDLMQALIPLEIIHNSDPGFRDVSERLYSARKNIDTAVAQKSEDSLQNAIVVSAMVLGALILPVLAIFLFSAGARARAHYWRGNYEAAVRVYEKILENNPGNARFYEPLANIYMLLGRSDSNAIRIYNVVLQLNPNINNRERYYQFISQCYLPDSANENRLYLEAGNGANSNSAGSNLPNFLELCASAVEKLDVEALQTTIEMAAVELNPPVFLSTVIFPLVSKMRSDGHRNGKSRQLKKMDESISFFLQKFLTHYQPVASSPEIVVTEMGGVQSKLSALLTANVAASEGWRVTYLKEGESIEKIVHTVRNKFAKVIFLGIEHTSDKPKVRMDFQRLSGELSGQATLIVGGEGASDFSYMIGEISGVGINNVCNLLDIRKLFNFLHSGSLKLPMLTRQVV